MVFEFPQIIKDDVAVALQEDLGGELRCENDITANLIDKDATARAHIITREAGILCGQQWASEAFYACDSAVQLQWHKEDGDVLLPSDRLLSISGNARAILTAERTALNFLQFLSATATTTHRYAQFLSDVKTQLLDTRKTLPRYRQAQKYAVVCGGGTNHRIGLYDAFLIKENHIKACGSIQKAVEKARTMAPDKPIEVEVESLDELNQAISASVDIVMLDNFNNEQILQAVACADGRCKLEVSGNIVEERLRELAQTGVDFVSSGALTKHVNALDLSLLIE
ncbi:carboxylating nicotinate-nucleotide diphosphorylase [Glaciecola sp. XM2]|uniref:carboxylating nicotinate-nucleotide diphosphorylase n=1 Tax=Glaciecola sp. XM2 TaxID=1914931 RepID=UPI001BDE7DD4|nr:carboxylating nicotinate-nucleotide diphosphorylase [Glaciecola sp. XM2]MBT1450530.1 carboxylating nicotinate-nucleotide diphosphorylase [Glaciecola sp. XM2]